MVLRTIVGFGTEALPWVLNGFRFASKRQTVGGAL